MSWKTRSTQKELLDLGPQHYSPKEYEDCLFQLDRIGAKLGGDKLSFKTLRNLDFIPKSFLDVGCGGGGFTKKLALKFPDSQVRGIDICDEAISYARKHNAVKNVNFDCALLETIPTKSVEVVMTTLVCHHLEDHTLIPFLKECLRVAQKKVIINDLHRHPCAAIAFKLIAPLFFRNRLIIHDGSLSIRRAFIKKDWQYYFQQLQQTATIEWDWSFRWLVTITPS